MSHSGARLLFWSPRILGILFIVFLSLFALDEFNGAYGFWHPILAFSLHLVPAFIVAAVLIVAWRWEWVGAALFSLAAALYAWRVLPKHASWAMTIAAPLVLIAGLFLANWIEREKLHSSF